ncbi:ATP-binding protein [Streptomyces cocklensis]|jgi:anti-sigma regulatory factor (Ser/Thr protein kinase)|uniref:Anti-sigma regulatory factor (Ser/Thr protein kinase) n=1 Tax=Actinacidiphila cocklensis TaxID=887465 RepID=A0A9W4DN34_9ACTN|nr:ATP-binding protein [Actinacidiphila cocklensis]MDD1062360.1 ATP-binding protein [Actinacidiphila cocklensis]WSX74239.1 ATP-binding protein [Streptomyces sp. NBC_00899]WSX79697.1 ATP-binding protein [Streptomyces sp. NBC_00899]CAG6392643.1 Anti-sigma regulatory factor (Ser/Thr protein kinase) [Actinacidiphila cocklensis]
MRILSPESAPSAVRSASSPKWAGRGQAHLAWPAGSRGGVPHPARSGTESGAGTESAADPGTDTDSGTDHDSGTDTDTDTDSGIGCLPLPHRPEAGGDARRSAQAVLDRWQLPEETASDVVLVISELVTNALNHALPAVCLHMSRLPCGTVRVEITDGGPCASPLQRDPGDGGRGLALVQALAQAHGRHVGPTGTLAWAEFAGPAPA